MNPEDEKKNSRARCTLYSGVMRRRIPRIKSMHGINFDELFPVVPPCFMEACIVVLKHRLTISTSRRAEIVRWRCTFRHRRHHEQHCVFP